MWAYELVEDIAFRPISQSVISFPCFIHLSSCLWINCDLVFGMSLSDPYFELFQILDRWENIEDLRWRLVENWWSKSATFRYAWWCFLPRLPFSSLMIFKSELIEVCNSSPLRCLMYFVVWLSLNLHTFGSWTENSVNLLLFSWIEILRLSDISDCFISNFLNWLFCKNFLSGLRELRFLFCIASFIKLRFSSLNSSFIASFFRSISWSLKCLILFWIMSSAFCLALRSWHFIFFLCCLTLIASLYFSNLKSLLVPSRLQILKLFFLGEPKVS